MAKPHALSVDTQEIQKFEAMAEEWWDPTGKFKPLHRFNPTRIRVIRDHAAKHFHKDLKKDKPFKGLSLVDIGCGGGLLSEPMTRLGFDVTGIDASEKNITIASLHASQQDLATHYRATTAEQLAEEHIQADIVLNMEVVEHVADVEKFLEASAALVKPGGLMFIATLNRSAKSLIMAKIGAEYILRWLPIGTHEWKKFLKPSEIETIISAHNLNLVDLHGMTYKPLKDDWEVTQDVSVNYLMVTEKGNYPD